MNGCKDAAEDKGLESASDILGYGFDCVESPGSSTACVISITENNILQVANLGDSGFFLLRKDESKYDSGDRRSPPPIEWAVVAATTEQLHSFNCPVQLGTSSNDTVECADVSAIELEVGDVTVCCTDGVLDNVWEDEISTLCADAFKESDACDGDMDMMREATELFCQNILDLAVRYAEDTERRSPFEANAKRWGFRYRGGKMDDITVVVSLVEGAEEEKVV
jgi:protein phosphatase PTC7